MDTAGTTLVIVASLALIGCLIVLVRSLPMMVRHQERWPRGMSLEEIARKRHAANLEVVFSLVGLVLALSVLVQELRAKPLVSVAHPAVLKPVTSMMTFEINPAFGPGETCSEKDVSAAIADAAEYIRRERSSGMAVAAIVMGGHDVRPLKPALRRKFGNNLVLSQRRADCVKARLEDVLRATPPLIAAGPDSQPFTMVALPAGSHYEWASHDTPVTVDRKREREVLLSTDRRATILVLSWGTQRAES